MAKRVKNKDTGEPLYYSPGIYSSKPGYVAIYKDSKGYFWISKGKKHRIHKPYNAE